MDTSARYYLDRDGDVVLFRYTEDLRVDDHVAESDEGKTTHVYPFDSTEEGCSFCHEGRCVQRVEWLPKFGTATVVHASHDELD